MSIIEAQRRFLEYLEIEKNRSPKTIENYDRYLGRFFQWAKIKTIEDITAETIRKYRLFLYQSVSHTKTPLKKSTQNYAIVVLRSFLRYLAKHHQNILPAESIELGKASEKDIDFLEPEEVERMIAAIPLHSWRDFRDKAIIELLFCSGLRVSELVALDRDHLNLSTGEFSVRGKGDKLRLIFLSPSTKEALTHFLRKRSDTHEALFITQKLHTHEWQRITARTIQRIVHTAAQAAGIVKQVHPHTLRHSFATHLLRNGADIRSVQTFLGHTSIVTTQRYTHVTNKHLKETYQEYFLSKKS